MSNVNPGKPTQSDLINTQICRRAGVSVHLDGNNESKNHNIFQVLGTIDVVKLYAEITNTSTIDNCTDFFFDLWDGLFSDVITKKGIDISGISLGSFLVKTEVSSQNISVFNPTTCLVTEQTDKKSYREFHLTQKPLTDTYVRLNYTTTDTPINAGMFVYVEYKTINGGSLGRI